MTNETKAQGQVFLYHLMKEKITEFTVDQTTFNRISVCLLNNGVVTKDEYLNILEIIVNSLNTVELTDKEREFVKNLIELERG